MLFYETLCASQHRRLQRTGFGMLMADEQILNTLTRHRDRGVLHLLNSLFAECHCLHARWFQCEVPGEGFEPSIW